MRCARSNDIHTPVADIVFKPFVQFSSLKHSCPYLPNEINLFSAIGDGIQFQSISYSIIAGRTISFGYDIHCVGEERMPCHAVRFMGEVSDHRVFQWK